ncbi:MAG TPA: 3-dehydroquinate synthase, partial [Chloroflexota bacterium]|nr:3-dehydroquinate synthase [Chloroflexota bacterium]
RRMEADGVALRPLLRTVGGDGNIQLNSIESLLERRAWIYDAYPAVSTARTTPSEAAAGVIRIFRQHREGTGGASYEVRFTEARATEIAFSPVLDSDDAEWLLDIDGRRATGAAIVWDEMVSKLYGDRFPRALARGPAKPLRITLKSGEGEKTLDTIRDLYARFYHAGFERGATVIAVGGGVVTDVVGFAAATYLRGLGLVNIPTTLLGQVDAAVGGKTGVDFEGSKNLIGSFYPADTVVIDMSALRSLPVPRLREGLAEMIKIAMVRDPGLLSALAELSSAEEILTREDLIRRSVRNKVECVNHDPLELSGERALLNFGHTIGHALESVAEYAIPHGECVAMGMAAEARMALRLGCIDQSVVDALTSAILGLGLPLDMPDVDPNALIDAMRKDKKRTGGRIRMVVPKGIGSAELLPVEEGDILATLKPGKVTAA